MEGIDCGFQILGFDWETVAAKNPLLKKFHLTQGDKESCAMHYGEVL